MSIKIIRNYNMKDVVDSLVYLLDKASHSQEVRTLAIQITQNSQDKISAMYTFLKSSVSYIHDPIGATGNEIELFVSPIVMVDNYSRGIKPSGDCDDMALLSTALFRSIGMRANIVLVDCVGQGIDHAFCEVYSDALGRFLDFDVTTDYPVGWSHPYHNRISI